MSLFRSIAVVLALLFVHGATHAADDELPPSVAAALRRAQIPTSGVGLVVQAVGAADRPLRGDGAAPSRIPGRAALQPLLALHADTPMNPASTMKLVTTYAALELLGPAFTWRTTMASNAVQAGSVLDGDLYLRGAGDPKLVVENLWLMLRQLRARGIRSIRGDLVLDRSLFAAVPYDPAAFDGEPFRPYNVGPDALLVNFKSVTVRFLPDDAKREVRVSMEPVLADFDAGAIAYGDGPCGDWRAKALADFTRVDRLVFAGTYPAACGEQTWNVAVLDHRHYAGALIRNLWSELGGTLTGRCATAWCRSTPAAWSTTIRRASPRSCATSTSTATT